MRTREYITTMLKPVIARIQGPAAGGGVYIATCCDIIVAVDDSWFAMREIHAGGHSGGSHLLSIGLQRAREINLTGRRVPAPEAERIGLINRSVPRDQLDEVVQDYIDQILAVPPLGVQATKQAMRIAMEAAGYATTFRGARAASGILAGTEDSREAKRAFVEKRPPVFKGR